MGFKPFLEGGIAAIIAGALTHPLYLIKVRMQLQGEHSFSLDQNPNHNLDLNLPVKPYRPAFALDSLIGSISLLPSSTPAPSTSTRSSMTPFAVGTHIVKTEGPAALFSGVSATVLRQMLYSATRMGIYDFLKRKWTDRLTGNDNKFYYCPTKKMSYGGPLDCAVKTVAEEGPMALYKGLVPVGPEYDPQVRY
ncbi:hypothetical protein F2Q70_00007243 [Brassica cretica]|uniref:ADP/ATP translocase n=2 Tax=Brassica cretica TaxID=69181 RepID=A0A8S9LUV2_BRACR|nr:hypothetical protein F2Q70_00007243 [Brassica cretica]